MSYVDPFVDLNDTKRREREALLNNPNHPSSASSQSLRVTNAIISRRDYFVAAAMQGLLAAGMDDITRVARLSAVYAHNTMKEIDAHGDTNTVG